MRSFQTLLVIAACLVSSSEVEAFQATAPRGIQHAQPLSSTITFLHPDQAADLEACAYDLMKEALEEEQRRQQEAQLNGSVDPNTMTPVGGPVAWCRRRLWPFASYTKNQANVRP